MDSFTAKFETKAQILAMRQLIAGCWRAWYNKGIFRTTSRFT